MCNTEALVDRWFHSFDEEGGLSGQGHIVALVGPNRYLVQWFSWMSGRPMQQSLVDLEEMKDWHFYDSGEQMNHFFRRMAESKEEYSAVEIDKLELLKEDP